MRMPAPPAWLGTPDLTQIASENRCDTALAFQRAIARLGMSGDDRIRILAHMMAMECAQAPALEQASEAAAYAAHLVGFATAAAWHGKVDAMLARPVGRA